MSDTESFESVYERLYPQLHNPCGLWKAATIAEWLDDLERAHDREIRDVSQREFARGMDAGQHSMDAEHRAVAMRLRQLPLDGGSHENLSQIARAIYHADFGWTHGACASLRDELVRLMGGFSDDTCGAGCCCAAADSDGDCGLQHEEVTDERLADDSTDDSRGGSGSELVHMDGLTTYDVLGNERRRVIAKLRKIPDVAESSYTYDEHLAMIYDALDVEAAPLSYSDLDEIRDNLIHLLGGDRPNGIDVLNGADLSKRSVDAMSKRAMKEREVEGRITDELREWARTEVVLVLRAKINCFADRIDAQFDRICQQQEAVLQETIADVVKEYEHDRESDQLRIEKLVRQRDAAYACADELSDELLRVRREHDEARDECDRLKRDMLDKWVPRTSYDEKVEKYRRAYMESDAWRKSLQEKLNAMRDAITAALNG